MRGQCKNDGGKFLPVVDGYYLETYILAGIGLIYWFMMSFKLIPFLEKQPEESWKVKELHYSEVKEAEKIIITSKNSSSSVSTEEISDKFESPGKTSPV